MELCPLEQFSGVGLLGHGVTRSEASAPVQPVIPSWVMCPVCVWNRLHDGGTPRCGLGTSEPAVRVCTGGSHTLTDEPGVMPRSSFTWECTSQASCTTLGSWPGLTA